MGHLRQVACILKIRKEITICYAELLRQNNGASLAGGQYCKKSVEQIIVE